LGRGFAAIVCVVAIALPGVAAAQLRLTGCGGANFGNDPVMDAMGGYSYIGAATVDGRPGIEFASGVGHHEDFGTEFAGFLSDRGLAFSLTARTPLLRLGLSSDWAGPIAPASSFLFVPRFGLATIMGATVPFGAYVGFDAEFLFFGAVLLAVRSGVYLPFDRERALARPIPLLSLSFGFAPGSVYGWGGP